MDTGYPLICPAQAISHPRHPADAIAKRPHTIRNGKNCRNRKCAASSRECSLRRKLRIQSSANLDEDRRAQQDDSVVVTQPEGTHVADQHGRAQSIDDVC